MCSQWAVLAMSTVAILSTVAKPLAPPTTGWLFNDFYNNSFILPLTATQCEPFDIFYNVTTARGDYFYIYDATISHLLFGITFPSGTGYVDWICNIPAGIGFYAGQNFIVQAGSSSACLGNITTTYSYLSYHTAAFESFTRNPSPLVTPVTTNTFPTTTFPTGGYPTITLNPILAVIPTTFPPSPVTSSTSSNAASPTMSSRSPTMSAPSLSSPVTPFISSPPSSTMPSRSPPSSIMSSPSSSSPSPSPTLSHKSRNAAVAGGVVGTVAFVLLILAIMFWRIRRRSGLASSPTNAQSATMGELGSAYPSPPSQSSGAELLGPTCDPCSHGNELKSDSGAMVAPVAGNLEPVVVPLALSPANIESTTGMPPATLSTQQSYEHSAIIGRDIGSHISHITINSLHIHQAHPDPSSSLPHLPEILSTTAAQASE